MKGNNNEQEVYVNVKKNGIYFLEHFKIPAYISIENWLLDNHPEYEFIDCGEYEDMLGKVLMANRGCRVMFEDGKCKDNCRHCNAVIVKRIMKSIRERK